MEQIAEKRFYTLKDIQNLFGISREKTSALVKMKDFPVVKIGRNYYVDKRDFEKWLSLHKKGCVVMNNFDKIKSLGSDEFWKEMVRLVKHNLSEYIDYTAWLESEDENLEHFLKSDEIIEVYPSEAELIALHNEHNVKFNTKERLSDTEIEAYRQQNKKEYLYLGKTKMFGTPYVTIVRNGQVWNVPENITGKIRKIKNNKELSNNENHVD